MAGTLPVARTPDWSVLPPELLQMIARKLPDIFDFVKFRAVCTTWRSSVSVSDSPPQLPWFLEEQDFPDGDLRFYSLSSGKIHTVHSPNSSGNWLRGPAHDYIVMYNATTYHISLLNPLTDRKVALPILDIVRAYPIWVSPDPIQSGECVVFWGRSANSNSGIMGFYQPVEREWVLIEEYCSFDCPDAYFNGMFFANEVKTGDTKVINTVTGKVVHVIPPPLKGENKCGTIFMSRLYLVQSGGDMLRVVLHDNKSLEVTDCHFHIHCLDLRSENGGKPRWVKMSNIVDQILFLDEDAGFSLSCRDFSGFRGNSIYFFNWQFQKDFDDEPLCWLYRYDIEEARAEPLTCPFGKGGTWIVPSLR